VPIGMTVNGQHYCAILQEKKGGYFAVNENCVRIVLFCARTMQHFVAIVIYNIWCNTGAGRCWHILPTLLISPNVINGCFKVWKNTFGVNDLNPKTVSTLLSQPLCRVMVCHIDGKSVWTVMLITLGRGSLWTFRNISSVVTLYFVITTQSYTKLLQWPTYLGYLLHSTVFSATAQPHPSISATVFYGHISSDTNTARCSTNTTRSNN
jgi:hypothetical protein